MKRLTILLLLLIALLIHSKTLAESPQVLGSRSLVETLTDKEMHYEAVPVPESLRAGLQEKFQAAAGGNDFWAMFPPNDQNAEIGNMSIYIGSGPKANTPIIVEKDGVQIWEGRIKDPYSCVTLCYKTGPKNAVPIVETDWEARERSDQIVTSGKGIHIYVPEEYAGNGYDIYVYVGSFRYQSADGYMALPSNGLGNRYIHCSHFDNHGDYGADWRTGFSVMAVYPETQVRIGLRTTFDYCVTETGRKGDSTGSKTYSSPLLQPGDIWNVMENTSSTAFTCDFTGTTIWGDKNFALISWVERTRLPANCYVASRDNLCEQLLPTSKWGRVHNSVQFLGPYESTSKWKNIAVTGDNENVYNNANPGQIFRVVAKEPNTTGYAEWHDIQASRQFAGRWPFTLNREGDYEEYQYLGQINTSDQTPFLSISGSCSWVSTKPVQIMMYSLTQGYLYTTSEQDPFMVLLPPVEQYGNNTTFISAYAGTYFSENDFSLYVEGPRDRQTGQPILDDAEVERLLNTVIVREGNLTYPVSKIEPNFRFNRIAGTNYFWARWKLTENQVYRIDAETRLSGQVYGWGGAVSYAWPTSMKLVEVGTFDQLPPEVYDSVACNAPTRPDINGRVMVSAIWHDTTDWPPSEFNDYQIDQGINQAPILIYDLNENLNIYRYYYYRDDTDELDNSYPPSVGWRTGHNFKRGRVEYSVNDPFLDVNAAIRFTDAAGNEYVDTILYIADKVGFVDASGLSLTYLDFGSQTVNGTYLDTIYIKNLDTVANTVYIDNTYFKGDSQGIFEIIEGSGSVELGPGQQHPVVIQYKPISTATVSDILYVNTKCLYFEIPVVGGSGNSTILVTDIDFGQQFVNTESGVREILITNNGTMDLHITGYYWDGPNTPAHDADPSVGTFRWSDPSPQDYPSSANVWTIEPGQTKSMRITKFTFAPSLPGQDSIRLVFTSDVYDLPTNKNYARLTGEGIFTGPILTDIDFGRRRVLTDISGEVMLINEGNTPLTIREIPLLAGHWTSTNTVPDTLYSRDNSYYIVGAQGLKNRVIQPHSSDAPIDEREIRIEVGFRPTSERNAPDVPAAGTCPLSDTFFINFQGGGVADNTIYSIIRGEAFLPKNTNTGYIWVDQVMQGTTSSVVGTVTLSNPSVTSDLQIRGINILSTSSSYQDFQTSVSLGSITSVNSGGSVEIPFTFTPANTNPPQRWCAIEIISDATTGPLEEPTVYDTIYLRGVSYDEGLIAAGYDYGRLTRCDSPLGQVTINNISTTSTMTVYSVEVEDAYKDVFVVQTVIDSNVVNSSSSLVVTYQFNPCDWLFSDGSMGQGDILAEVYIRTNTGDTTVLLKGSPFVVPMRLTLPEISGEAGKVYAFPIQLDLQAVQGSTSSISEAGITEFTLVLKADRRYVHFEGGKDAVNGWTFTISKHDASTNTITITGNGPALIGATTLVIPHILVLLSEVTTIPVSVESIVFNGRECCTTCDISDGGRIDYIICAQEVRGNQTLSGSNYSVAAISPNPFSGQTLPINYSIGLEGPTSIMIYNSNGDLVKNVFDGVQTLGAHTNNVDVSNLGSGAYNIILKSGPFEENQSLIILR